MVTKSMLSEEIIIDMDWFVKKPHGFVVFAGKNGRGKSYAAMRVYEKLTPYRLPSYDHDLAWFINQAELNIRFSDDHEKYGSATHLLKQAQRSKLLILDDLGTRPPSSAFMDFLYAVIDHRDRNQDGLGTIITTNLDSSGIRRDLGDAIFSRSVSGQNYVFTGPDRRFSNLGF